MSTYITLFIVLANIIAILLVYYSFGKNTEKQKKLLNTMIIVGIIYIIILIVYDLSTIGIDKNSVSDTAKTIMTITFVPVNTILFAPFLIISYIHAKEKSISVNKLNVRVAIVAIIAILVLMSEFFFFRDSQKKINAIQKQLENANNTTQNEVENTIENNTEQKESNNITNTNNNIVNNNTINKITNTAISNIVTNNTTK